MPDHNPENWEEKLLNIEGFRKKLNGEEVSTVILLIRSLLSKARQEEREAVLREVEEMLDGIIAENPKEASVFMEGRRHGINRAKYLLSLREQGDK